MENPPTMSVETQQPYEPAYQQSPAAPLPEPETRFSFLRGWVGIALAGLLAVGVAVGLVALLTGGGSSGNGGTLSSSSKENAFNISYPKTWSPLPTDKVASLPGQPLAVLRRNDGQGVVVIRREAGAPPADLNKLGADLGQQLKRRVPGLKLHTSKLVKIRSGTALYTSYITKQGRVQSIVVVPAGKRTFSINTISGGGADNVAREIGKMILSFDAQP
jgi:hypothetical protein